MERKRQKLSLSPHLYKASIDNRLELVERRLAIKT